MQLTFREIEKAFEIQENTLYQWLNARGMPAVEANGQYYFNSAEVLEWALKNHIPLTLGILNLCAKNLLGADVFASALMRGGVYFGLKAASREVALEKILELLPLPAEIKKIPLKEMLLSREQTGTTCVGEGIAIPHVKHPVVFSGMEPMIGLFFLENPVDFGALDGQRVHTLFVILSASFKKHLLLLSRLAFCLQDVDVKTALGRRQSRQEIIAAFKAAESKIAKVS